ERRTRRTTRIKDLTLSQSYEKFRSACRFRPGPFDYRLNARQNSMQSTKGMSSRKQVKGQNMKVMVIGRATKASEAGEMPSMESFAAMEKYNQELIDAGILLDGTGLTPSSRGARVRFSGSKRTVIDGPFAETKELIAGFSIWKVSSLQEAIDWVKK